MHVQAAGRFTVVLPGQCDEKNIRKLACAKQGSMPAVQYLPFFVGNKALTKQENIHDAILFPENPLAPKEEWMSIINSKICFSRI